MGDHQKLGHNWVLDYNDPNPHDTLWYCTRCGLYHLQPSDMSRPTSEMKKRSRLSGDMVLTCEETQILNIQEG